jgi:prolyl-tRNA synthetase
VHVDSREQYTPGWKFNEWELKGVPLRVEIGPKDVEKNQVTLVRRDNSQKLAVKDDAILGEVQRCLDEIQKSLYSKAKSALNDSISQATDYEQFKKTLNDRGGFVRACWCGRSECEEAIKNETGATIRTIPLTDEKPFSSCIYCSNTATKVTYFAKSY